MGAPAHQNSLRMPQASRYQSHANESGPRSGASIGIASHECAPSVRELASNPMSVPASLFRNNGPARDRPVRSGRAGRSRRPCGRTSHGWRIGLAQVDTLESSRIAVWTFCRTVARHAAYDVATFGGRRAYAKSRGHVAARLAGARTRITRCRRTAGKAPWTISEIVERTAVMVRARRALVISSAAEFRPAAAPQSVVAREVVGAWCRRRRRITRQPGVG